MNGKYDTLEKALEYISYLEKSNNLLKEENEELKRRLEKYDKMKPLGRPKHDDRWQASYDLFVQYYENGEQIPLIIEKTGFSRRTIYRYKAYYDSLIKYHSENNK